MFVPTQILLFALACSSGQEGLTEESCEDGIDNDGNGLADCDDAGCLSYDICEEEETTDSTGSGTSGGAGTSGGGTGTGTTSSGGGADPTVVINEFMASNASTVTDEKGAYPDWVELYNTTDEDIDLDGWTITDDLEESDKHELVGLSIDADDYLLLWADGDIEDGDRHLDFRLAADGEALGLFDPDGNAHTQLNYGQQATDHSAARVPDGSANWEITDSPTPGESND